MTVALTTTALSQILNRDVEEIHLTVAKGLAMGMDLDALANTVGVDKVELEDLTHDAGFKDLRLLVGAEFAREKIDRDMDWDTLENKALAKLNVRVERETDMDTLLRIAAVANRATRRTVPPKESVLDPTQAGARVPLTLTRRFIEKLNGSGQVVERSQIQQISVLDGSAVNPQFKEVQDVLRPIAQEPRTQETQLRRNDFAEEEMDLSVLKALAESMKK